MAIWIAEKGHPELVIGHPGDQVRAVFKRHSPLLQGRVDTLDVGDLEIDAYAGWLDILFWISFKHQANAIAIGKDEIAEAIEKRELQCLAVEHLRGVCIGHGERDLADRRQILVAILSSAPDGPAYHSRVE
jgi:hypothetical protein